MCEKPYAKISLHKKKIILLATIMLVMMVAEAIFLKAILTPVCAAVIGTIFGVAIFYANKRIIKQLVLQKNKNISFVKIFITMLVLFIIIGAVLLLLAKSSKKLLLGTSCVMIIQFFVSAFDDIITFIKSDDCNHTDNADNAHHVKPLNTTPPANATDVSPALTEQELKHMRIEEKVNHVKQKFGID